MSIFEEALEAMLERVVRKVMRECGEIAATPTDELVTMAAFARRRSISESTVRAAIRSGQLPAVKIGRAVRVSADAQIGKPAPTSGANTKPDTPRARAVRILGRLQ
jgi:excisionase family DNA binding protein